MSLLNDEVPAEDADTTDANPDNTADNNPTDSPNDDSWLSGLPEDMRDNENLTKFSSVEALAKSYVNAQRLIGREKIPMPKTEDEFREVYARLGRPESAEGYELGVPDLPEGIQADEQMMGQFREVAHEIGLNQSQIEKLNSWYWDAQVGQLDSFNVQQETSIEENITSLRNEWGERFDQNVQLAQRAVQKFGGDAVAEVLEQTGLGNDKNVVMMFHKIAAATMEDATLQGSGNSGTSAMSPDQIKGEISSLMANPAYMDKSAPDHQSVVNQIQSLYKRMHK